MQNSDLESQIKTELSKCKGHFAVAIKYLNNNKTILINENDVFHAASTMKTPVMVEVFNQALKGKLNLSDSVLIKNEFKSIVDGSLFSMDISDDSGDNLYGLIGEKVTVYDLVMEMITVSGNLATNLLIELVDAKSVMKTLTNYGIKGVNVLRGVEDGKAFEKGLNNTVTAYGLMCLYEKIALGEIVSESASDSMINILLAQKHKSMIPSKLPEGFRVANKTGSISGVKHDSGIIFYPDGRKAIVVLLSKDIDSPECINTIFGEIASIIVRE